MNTQINSSIRNNTTNNTALAGQASFPVPVIEKQTYEQRLMAMVKKASDAAQKEVQRNAMSGIFEPMYLYYRSSTEFTDGDLLMLSDSSEEVPASYVLATGEGLRGNIPYDKYYQWIHSRTSRLPILAWGF